MVLNQQAAADRAARRDVRLAYKQGRTVGYSLARLVELKISTKVLRAVYRGGCEARGAPGASK